MIHNIFTIKRNRTISPLIAAVGIFLILILPLCGLPVNVPGIPVWYQDTFFIALVCGGIIGLIAVVLYISGRFRRIQWNVVDGLVLLILAYSMVRLTFQETIPHKSMSLSREFYQSRQYLERALHFSSDPVIFTTLGQDYTLFSKVEPEKVERAEFLLKMAKYMEPSRYYPRYLLMELYTRIGQKEKEQEEAAGILAMDTKVVSEAVDQILEMARNTLNHSNKFIIKNTSKTPAQE